MDAALEEAADLRTSIRRSGDAALCSMVLLSEGCYCKGRRD